jgi:hypothetical protein
MVCNTLRIVFRVSAFWIHLCCVVEHYVKTRYVRKTNEIYLVRTRSLSLSVCVGVWVCLFFACCVFLPEVIHQLWLVLRDLPSTCKPKTL